jgi:putative Mn2+ efflux pump MntP
MMKHTLDGRKQKMRPMNILFGATIFFLTVTGFAQMPIFKRYYIADIPGLGWLAQYYITHYMHYLFAILLLALGTYLIVEYLAGRGNKGKPGVAVVLKTTILMVVALSGLLLVIRNLAANPFSSGTIVLLNLVHLGGVMLLLGGAFIGLLLKRRKNRVAERAIFPRKLSRRGQEQ